jgi:hypothetical protein
VYVYPVQQRTGDFSPVLQYLGKGTVAGMCTVAVPPAGTPLRNRLTTILKPPILINPALLISPGIENAFITSSGVSTKILILISCPLTIISFTIARRVALFLRITGQDSPVLLSPIRDSPGKKKRTA